VRERDCSPSSGFSSLFDRALGELQPLPGKLFVLSFAFVAPAVRELLAFCRVGAEFFS
jgi:hypothetical protein